MQEAPEGFDFMTDEAQKIKYKKNPKRKESHANLYSIREAADKIGVTKEALYYRIWHNLLPVKVIGGHYYIHKKDFMSLKSYYIKKRR